MAAKMVECEMGALAQGVLAEVKIAFQSDSMITFFPDSLVGFFISEPRRYFCSFVCFFV